MIKIGYKCFIYFFLIFKSIAIKIEIEMQLNRFKLIKHIKKINF